MRADRRDTTLLASHRMESLSIDDISTRTDVAKDRLHNYFVDKDALAARGGGQSTCGDRDREHADQYRRRRPRGARAFACVLHFGLTQPVRARAMRRMFPHTTDPLAPTNRSLRAGIAGGLKSSRFSVTSEEAAVVFTMGVTQEGLCHATDLGNQTNVIRLAREVGVALLRGLGEPHAPDEIDRSSCEGGLPSD